MSPLRLPFRHPGVDGDAEAYFTACVSDQISVAALSSKTARLPRKGGGEPRPYVDMHRLSKCNRLSETQSYGVLGGGGAGCWGSAWPVESWSSMPFSESSRPIDE